MLCRFYKIDLIKSLLRKELQRIKELNLKYKKILRN
jgi:hypothetical protein